MRCVEDNGKLRLKSLDDHKGKKTLVCEDCGKAYEFEKRGFGMGWKLVKV